MLKVGGIYKDKHSDNICFIIISISNKSSYLICEGFYIQNTKDFSNKSILNFFSIISIILKKYKRKVNIC